GAAHGRDPWAGRGAIAALVFVENGPRIGSAGSAGGGGKAGCSLIVITGVIPVIQGPAGAERWIAGTSPAMKVGVVSCPHPPALLAAQSPTIHGVIPDLIRDPSPHVATRIDGGGGPSGWMPAQGRHDIGGEAGKCPYNRRCP